MKRELGFLCLIISSLSSSFAQGIAIHGRAIDADDHPVPHIKVRISNLYMDTFAVDTGEDGSFSISGLRPARYTFGPVTAGWMLDLRALDDVPRTGVMLAERQEPHDVIVHVVKSAVISGRILDSDREPEAGVRIRAVRSARQTGSAQLSGGDATTDDRGLFRISGLLPGPYYLVTVPMEVPKRYRAVYHAPPGTATYFPGVANPSSARLIELRPGENYVAEDKAIVTDETFKITGRVVDQAGNPRSNGYVTIAPEDFAGNIQAFSSVVPADEDGFFEATSKVAGTYRIMALDQAPPSDALPIKGWMRPGEPASVGEVVVRVTNRDVENVTLVVNPSHTIRGTIDNLGPGKPHLKITLSPVNRYLGRRDLETETDDNGAFEFQEAYAASFAITLDPLPSGKYLKTIRIGERDRSTQTIDLTNPDVNDLHLALADGALSISGSVEGGQPGKAVSAWRATAGDDRVWPAVSDGNGKFTIDHLPPGAYYVAAWPTVDPSTRQDKEIVSRFNADAVLVDPDEQVAKASPIVVPSISTARLNEILEKH